MFVSVLGNKLTDIRTTMIAKKCLMFDLVLSHQINIDGPSNLRTQQACNCISSDHNKILQITKPTLMRPTCYYINHYATECFS